MNTRTRFWTSSRSAGAVLLIVAMLWGSTFFVNKNLVVSLPPADMTGVRYTISAIVLAVVLHRHLRMSFSVFWRGVIVGLFYGIAQLLQMFGITMVAASVSGFLTGLYAVFTALATAIILRRSPSRWVWAAVVLGTFALGVLTLGPGAGSGFGMGEALTLACAVMFAGHIVVNGLFVSASTAASLAIVQTGTAGVVSLIAALPGGLTLPSGPVQWASMLYLAILCGSVTMFAQAWAQARMESAQAAIIMSSEPLWAAVFAIMAGQEPLTMRTVIGGSAMMAAIWLSVRSSPEISDEAPVAAPAGAQQAVTDSIAEAVTQTPNPSS